MRIITCPEKSEHFTPNGVWSGRFVHNRWLLFLCSKIWYVATYRNKWAFYAPVEQLRRCVFSPEMSTQQTGARKAGRRTETGADHTGTRRKIRRTCREKRVRWPEKRIRSKDVSAVRYAACFTRSKTRKSYRRKILWMFRISKMPLHRKIKDGRRIENY